MSYSFYFRFLAPAEVRDFAIIALGRKHLSVEDSSMELSLNGGCADIFVTDPQKYLQEISDLIVCPSCLGEKPRRLAVKEEIAGQEVYFCRCPHCIDSFREKPDYFLQRLEW